MDHYSFPRIEHIDDIWPHVKDYPGINRYVREDAGYTIVIYAYADSGADGTFPPVSGLADKLVRECRGLVFDNASGKLLSRRYHKFFNMNERDETQRHLLDLTRPHVILEKLDGSMVSPVELANGQLRLMTKSGITPTSTRAEAVFNAVPAYEKLAREMLAANHTPLFEWCSRADKIVVDHPQDQLVLTAVRDTYAGSYVTHQQLTALAGRYNIPVVGTLTTLDLAAQEGLEGAVLRFDDGHMLKVKTAWYVRLHDLNEMLRSERRLLDLLVHDQLDDVLAAVDADMRHKLQKYADEYAVMRRNWARDMCAEIMRLRALVHDDRKAFAAAKDVSQMVRTVAFKLWNEDWANAQGRVEQEFVRLLTRSLIRESEFERSKPDFFPQGWPLIWP